MWTLGRKLAPSGGLDSIANALFYVMVWRSLVWGPPIILTLFSLFSWLYTSIYQGQLWVASASSLLLPELCCGC